MSPDVRRGEHFVKPSRRLGDDARVMPNTHWSDARPTFTERPIYSLVFLER
jgi:hypothetical protein